MKNGRIREAEIADAQALLAIYEPYVLDTAITFEYDVPSTEEFADRIRHTKEQYPYLVLEDGGRAVGYTAKYHITLRQQLARPLETVLEANGRRDLLPLSGVLAETMLSCALNPDLGSHQFALLASTWMR